MPPLPTDTNFFVSGSVGARGTAIAGTSLFGGDVVSSGSITKIDISGATPIILDDPGIILTPGTVVEFGGPSENIFGNGSDLLIGSGKSVLIMSGGSGTSPIPHGVDTNFFVSGAIGSKNSTTLGTAVFGGDVVVSGSIYSTHTSITSQNFSVASTEKWYAPTSCTEGLSTGNGDHGDVIFMAPYSGSLKRINIVTKGGTWSQLVFAFYVNGVVTSHMTQSMNASAIGPGYLSGIRKATFDFTGNEGTFITGSTSPSFNPNDIISISVKAPLGSSRDCGITTVLLFNDIDTPQSLAIIKKL